MMCFASLVMFPDFFSANKNGEDSWMSSTIQGHPFGDDFPFQDPLRGAHIRLRLGRTAGSGKPSILQI